MHRWKDFCSRLELNHDGVFSEFFLQSEEILTANLFLKVIMSAK